MSNKPKVRICLWFDGDVEEAAQFYISLLAKSGIETVSRPEPGKPALVVELSLAGTPYTPGANRWLCNEGMTVT